MSQIRRLAAILAADVVGYSRLMAADEDGTLERLKALRRELLDPKIAAHHGRIPGSSPGTKTTGWRPGDDHGSISASNPAAVSPGQMEKLALDLGEQAWRKEAVSENSRPTRYRLKARIGPLIDIVLGDDNPTRFVVQPDSSPDLRRDLDPDGIT
jgi:class 3 adenylate cyclase